MTDSNDSVAPPGDGSTTVRIAGAEIIGRRQEQQDRHAWAILSEDPVHVLAVVADGMGGEVGGGVASSLAVDAACAAYRGSTADIPDRLRTALTAANEAIAQKIASKPALDGMGCTLVVLAVTPAGAQWISVGDSPLWLARHAQLARLNADHSMKPTLARLVEAGRLSAEDAARDPQRSALRSCVCGDQIDLVDGPSQSLALAPGDALLMASDGLETLSSEEIAAVIHRGRFGSTKQSVAALLAAVEARGRAGQDNATAILIKVGTARAAGSGLLARLKAAFGS